ncbi:hypothetical protein HOD29_05460 [archaeon]|jgi:hypothetical protein|nr:hypothetical protein [archaeon]
MTTLEKVSDLKRQGLEDSVIISMLQSEGVAPKEINDSLNQAKIKNAVTDDSGTQGMEPSVMIDENQQATQMPTATQEKVPTPASVGGIPQAADSTQQETSVPQDIYVPEAEPQDTYVPQAPANYPPQTQSYEQPQYQEETYEQQEGYAPQEYYAGGGTDASIEVAEQVFSEKIKKVDKKLKDLNEFKTIYQTRIDDVVDRLKRMEKMFDKMQLVILEKVGEYGKNVSNVKKELEMIEDTFSKVVNPLTDKKHHKK